MTAPNNQLNIMKNDQLEEQNYEMDVSRASTINHQSSDHKRIDKIVNQIVISEVLSLPLFITSYQTHSGMKDQTKLIEKILENRQLVLDLIQFQVNPLPMVQKYKLERSEALKYVTTICQFLHQNYQFYEHYFLKIQQQTFTYDAWFCFLQNKQDEVYISALGYLQAFFVPYVKYEYSTSSRITEYFEQKFKSQKRILIISHFNQRLICHLLKHTAHSPVFKILFHVVLASLQQQQWDKSLNLLKLLCHSGIYHQETTDMCIENLVWMVKEVSNNITKDIHNSIFAFTDSIVQSELVRASLNRISRIINLNSNQTLLEADNEITLQFNFKMLTEIMNIYYLLRKNGISQTTVQMKKLFKNILQIFHDLGPITVALQQIPSKTTRFSNGQNVKLTLFYRYELLHLIRTVLTLLQDYPQLYLEMEKKMDKAFLLQFVLWCIGQNRWNNIFQCQAEQIMSMLICGDLIKNNSGSLMRLLKFVVQKFSNKKYIFLNSAAMINHGDISFLSQLTKKIILELEKNPGILDTTSQYDFWKGFVLNIFHKYEISNDRVSKVCDEDIEISDEKSGDFRVEIDQIAVIKQFIKKIQVNEKWSHKRQLQSSVLKRTGSASQLKHNKIPHQNSDKSGSPAVYKSGLNIIKKSKSIIGEDGNGDEEQGEKEKQERRYLKSVHFQGSNSSEEYNKQHPKSGEINL